jgi:hypothetical protein
MLDAAGERQGGYRRQGEGLDHVFHRFWNFPQRYTKNRPYCNMAGLVRVF